jgi:hypothetical protein
MIKLQTTSCGFHLQVVSDGQVPLRFMKLRIPPSRLPITLHLHHLVRFPLQAPSLPAIFICPLHPLPSSFGDPNRHSLSQESTLSSAPSRISPTRYWQQQIGFGLVNPNMVLDDDHITEVTTEDEEELVELPATGSGMSSRDESLLVNERASSELNIDAIDSSSVRSFPQ